MAELLIRASKHWLDDHTQAQVDAMPQGDKDSYNARTQIGDIIVVKPDGWEWGKEECLPTFLVVKLPQVDVATVEHFTQSLMDMTNPDNPKMLKRRKYRIPENWVSNKALLGESVIEITLSAQKQALIDSIVEKTS